MSSDTSADDYLGTANVINRAAANQLVSTTAGVVDLHLKAGADAIDSGKDLSGSFTDDIDAQTRSGAWDVGADEYGAGTGRMLVKSGLYTGNALDNRAIFVGFRPDVVLIKRDQGSASGLDYFPQVRTSTMAGDMTKNMSYSGVATYAGGIQSLDATGFTIGTNAAVNTNGAPFYWVALKAAPGELKVGSYVGDGVDNRSITGIGFRPDYVMILPAGAVDPVHRSSAMPGEMTLGIDSLIYATNAVQALQADGFQVGTAPQANQNGATYYYVAARSVTGRIGVGQYTGNGAVLNVDSVGFQPEWVMVRKTTTSRPWVHKPAATGVSVDYNLFFNDYAGSTQDITQLRPLGFQVTFGPEAPGTDRANDNGGAYYWVAFGPHAASHELPLDRHRRRLLDRHDRSHERLGDRHRHRYQLGGRQPRARRRDRDPLPQPADVHGRDAVPGPGCGLERLARALERVHRNERRRPELRAPAATHHAAVLVPVHLQPGRLPVLRRPDHEPRRRRPPRDRDRLRRDRLHARGHAQHGLPRRRTRRTTSCSRQMPATATTAPGTRASCESRPPGRPHSWRATTTSRSSGSTSPTGGRGVDIQTPFGGTGRLVLRNNLLHDFTQDAVRFVGAQRCGHLQQLHLRGSGDGIDLGGFSSKAKIHNNTIYGNTLTGITGCTNPDAVFRNNIVVGNTGGQIGCTGARPRQQQQPGLQRLGHRRTAPPEAESTTSSRPTTLRRAGPLLAWAS